MNCLNGWKSELDVVLLLTSTLNPRLINVGNNIFVINSALSNEKFNNQITLVANPITLVMFALPTTLQLLHLNLPVPLILLSQSHHHHVLALVRKCMKYEILVLALVMHLKGWDTTILVIQLILELRCYSESLAHNLVSVTNKN
jgi:hypothetical protein